MVTDVNQNYVVDLLPIYINIKLLYDISATNVILYYASMKKNKQILLEKERKEKR